MRKNSPILIALLAVACGAPAKPTQIITLADTPDTLVVAVNHLSHAVPLSGDRWVVLASQESQITLVDFAAKKVQPYPGISKAEVTRPTVLFGLGDTLVVGDFALRRVTRWLPDQPRIDATPMTDATRGTLPRARDAAGHWYFQVPSARRTESKVDSALILRADPLLTHFDTLARLAPPDMAAVEEGGAVTYAVRAFSGEDRWGVLADGTLWIARNYQNRIDWYSVGAKKPEIGIRLPDPVLALSDMDKEIYIRRFPADQQEVARQVTPWSPIKPPFEMVFRATDGKMWLFKEPPALDSVRTFQIVDKTGVKLLVAVPSRGDALGISGDAILMGEEFPGGIRLLRYPIPAEALKN